ncbi:MAG: hypothetical protein ACD_18C00347G0026 [uncultured bacterium]|nr:MAG: hypothetical protein ACD_18C00347G0026 [uncultured bacterium]HAO52012.1 hypothetical protein [Candidatus Magasanikbacteria bacterium]
MKNIVLKGLYFTFVASIALFASLFFGSNTYAYEYQKIERNDSVEAGFFGDSVDISGTYMVAGNINDNIKGDYAGSIYIYQLNNDDWNQQQKIVPTDLKAHDRFGVSVSIDNDYIAVGSRFGDGVSQDSGAVYIYKKINNTWQLYQKIFAEDGEGTDEFGTSVFLEGSRLVVGAVGDDDKALNAGAVYVFSQDSHGIWTKEEKILPSDGRKGDNFGASVSLSGNLIAVGSPFSDKGGLNAGASYVYSLKTNACGFVFSKLIKSCSVDSTYDWVEKQKLLPSNLASGDNFGHSVVIDGDYVVVGVPYSSKRGLLNGLVYVFRLDNVQNYFVQQVELYNNDFSSADYFGFSLDMYNDTLVVGAINHINSYGQSGFSSGSVYVFHKQEEGVYTFWTQESELRPSDGHNEDYFGQSVAIDNSLVVVGSPLSDSDIIDSGAIYYYDISHKIDLPEFGYHNQAGYSIAVDGNTMVVGAPYSEFNGSKSGVVYVYHWDGTKWQFQTKLMGEGVEKGDLFGWSVDISGDDIVVGSPGCDFPGQIDYGTVYIFHKSVDGNWQQVDKLYTGLSVGESYVGYSVDIENGFLVVGASLDYSFDESGNFNLSGAVYFYKKVFGVWTLEQKITPENGHHKDYFGKSLVLDGDTLVIGAPFDNENDERLGAVYIYNFDKDSEKYILKNKIRGENYGEGFGYDVDIENGLLVLGAPYSKFDSHETGAVYVYRNDINLVDWNLEAILHKTGLLSKDLFGFSVSVHNNTIMVGAPYSYLQNIENAGSVDFFMKPGRVWLPATQLVLDDAISENLFGYSVYFDDNFTLVGAPGADYSGEDSGSIYSY